MVARGAGKRVPVGKKRAPFLKPIGVRARNLPNDAFVCLKHIGDDGMLVSDGVARSKLATRPGGSLEVRSLRRLIRTGTLSEGNVADAVARAEEDARAKSKLDKAVAVAREDAMAARDEGTKLRFSNFDAMDKERAAKLLHQETGFRGFGLFNLFVDFIAGFRDRDEILGGVKLVGNMPSEKRARWGPELPEVVTRDTTDFVRSRDWIVAV
mmetsp:Transcript_24979/g.69936  ORF Transcript_24979/g.69936 Transcript_24979/m.69936 type:complete len:211 (-) Transcript_24979:728-1360(-)